MEKYKLVVEGDLDLMRQVCSAVELQGRLCLNQTSEVRKLWEDCVYENAKEKKIDFFGATDEQAGDRRKTLREFREWLDPVWLMVENHWRSVFGTSGTLFKLSPRRSKTERRSYVLWKHMEHCLLHLMERPEDDSFLRSTVHYEYPHLLGEGVLKVKITHVQDE